MLEYFENTLANVGLPELDWNFDLIGVTGIGNK